jgi:hypothetical protein
MITTPEAIAAAIGSFLFFAAASGWVLARPPKKIPAPYRMLDLHNIAERMEANAADRHNAYAPNELSLRGAALEDNLAWGDVKIASKVLYDHRARVAQAIGKRIV